MDLSDDQSRVLAHRTFQVTLDLIQRIAIGRFQRECPPQATLDYGACRVTVGLAGGVGEVVYQFRIAENGEIALWRAGAKPPPDVAADMVIADLAPVPQSEQGEGGGSTP